MRGCFRFLILIIVLIEYLIFMLYYCIRFYSDFVREIRYRWGNRGVERGRIYLRLDKVSLVYLRLEF